MTGTGPIPLTILTGFLGSGKTTLLRRFLTRRQAAGHAVGVVVNEYGEIGLDQRLVVHASEHLEVLSGGCMCCARRADVAKALHDLVRRARGEGASRIDEAVIETSGLADPSPIISTVLADPWLRNNVSLRGVVVVLDAVNGLANLASMPEAVRQVAIANTVVISKTDMRGAAERSTLEDAVRRLVPDAVVLDAQDPEFDVASVMTGAAASFTPPATPPAATPPAAGEHDDDGGHATQSFVLDPGPRVDWPAFTVWLSALLHRHGDRILRVKGSVTVSSTGRPLVIHGVQHVMYPPVHLPERREGDRDGLVFITQGLGRERVERSLRRYLDWADALRPAS